MTLAAAATTATTAAAKPTETTVSGTVQNSPRAGNNVALYRLEAVQVSGLPPSGSRRNSRLSMM